MYGAAVSILDYFRKEVAPNREPTLEEARRDREAELRRALDRLDASAELLGARIQEFRDRHFALVRGQSVLISPHMNARDKLDSEWRELDRTACALQVERNTILDELSKLTLNPRESVHIAGRAVSHAV